MRRVHRVAHDFVDEIPDALDESKLYISVRHATILHLCLCGCGNEVVTPLAPTDWRLAFDGETVSLHPSVGNWALPCRSHYWIDRDQVRWAGSFSEHEVEMVRAFDDQRKAEYYEISASASQPSGQPAVSAGRWSRMTRWLSRRG
jgi:hypothetical protein